MSGEFYIYEHWRSDKNECFYVGKGQKRRAYDMRQRNRHHKSIRDKLQRTGHSIDVRIVIRDLSELQAFSEEAKRIAFWRNDGATLANLADGGVGGHTGVRHTEEWKAALGRRMRALMADPEYKEARRARMRGHKWPEESKAKVRRPKSPEHIAAIREAAKTRKKPIPRTHTHKENLAKAMAEVRKRQKSDPLYLARLTERRSAREAEKSAEKLRRIEQADINRNKQTFLQFVYALIDGTEKRCASCGMTCAPSEFPKNNQNKKTGLGSHCNRCCARYQRELRSLRRGVC